MLWSLKNLCLVSQPFIPHVSEEIWSGLGEKSLCINSAWPKETVLKNNQAIKIVAQINGKTRGVFEFENGVTKKIIIEKIKNDEKILKYIKEREILREIYVPNKIFNIVI